MRKHIFNLITKLTAITYFQEIVNHLGLIECDGPSEKTESISTSSASAEAGIAAGAARRPRVE